MIQRFFKRLVPSELRSRRSAESGYSNGTSQFPIDWIVPGQLAVGRLPSASAIPSLQQAGIRAVLALCAESEGAWPLQIREQFRCMRCVLPDSHYLSRPTAQQIGAAVELVHESIERSEPIFVHCLAGIERSPSVCVAYLCRYQHLPLWQALDWMKQVHPESMPNEFHIQAIRAYLEQRESWSDRVIA